MEISRYNDSVLKQEMPPATLERACLLFSALSNPVRLRIVELLKEGERTVGDIAEEVGIGQSGASQHLAVLYRAGILRSTSRGSSRYFRLRGPRIAGILCLITQFCEAHGLSGTDDVQEPE
jgi:DNA-binding transcriptional ArsR family regulator